MFQPSKVQAMKHALIAIFTVLCLFTGFAPSYKAAPVVSGDPNSTSNQMRLKIGTNTFTATLYDNATATAFKKPVAYDDQNG